MNKSKSIPRLWKGERCANVFSKGDRIDIEVLIKAFAKAKRIKPSEFPKFREQIILGLERMGFGKEVDIEKYKEVVKNGRLHEKR